MSKSGRCLRLFVAFYPEPELVTSLLDRLRGLDLPAYAVPPKDQIHLTVLFVGDTQSAELPNIYESIERAAAGVEPFTLRIERLGALPERGQKRLIAALCAKGPRALHCLHERLAQRLVAKRRGGPLLLPHLTLARFKSPCSFELADPSRCDLAQLSLDLPCQQVRLVESRLEPEGAQHRVLKSARLGSA